MKLLSTDRKALINDLRVVTKWSMDWDMPLNDTKCQLLTNQEVGIKVDDDEYDLSIRPVATSKDLGVKISADFKPAKQCLAAANKARSQLFRLKNVVTDKSPDVFLPYFKTIVRPHLEYCVQAWAPHLQQDIDKLEKVQHLATRMIKGMRNKSYEDRLTALGLFSLERRRLRGDLIEVFKILSNTPHTCGVELCLAGEQATRGHRLKLLKFRSRLDVRAKFFSQRVVNHWNKLPAHVIDSRSVDEFKMLLDRVWKKVFLRHSMMY